MIPCANSSSASIPLISEARIKRWRVDFEIVIARCGRGRRGMPPGHYFATSNTSQLGTQPSPHFQAESCRVIKEFGQGARHCVLKRDEGRLFVDSRSAHVIDWLPEPPNCKSPRMLHNSRGQTMRRNQTLCFDEVHHFLDDLFDGDLHAKRVLSLTNAILGVIKTTSLAVNAIGRGLALARGLVTKRAIKQVDRLLSNEEIDINAALCRSIPYMVGIRTSINVAMDWYLLTSSFGGAVGICPDLASLRKFDSGISS